MTTKQFVALENSLLPAFPNFVVKGSLMFIPPAERILRGISFEGSSFDKTSFYVTVFVMPLCVPTQHLYFLFGDRVRHLGGGDRWSIGMPKLTTELSAALELQAMPFLSRVESLSDFVEMAKAFRGNPHTAKAIAMALAREGRFNEAIDVIEALIPQLDLKVHWQVEIFEQVKGLREKLVISPAEGRQQVLNWEVESIRNLKLEEKGDRQN